MATTELNKINDAIAACDQVQEALTGFQQAVDSLENALTHDNIEFFRQMTVIKAAFNRAEEILKSRQDELNNAKKE
jgi:prefoldin subunit 5